MSSREELARGEGGANHTGHLLLSSLSLAFILTEMGLSGRALGRRFGRFSLATAVVTLVGGGYVASTQDTVAANEPTPWMGLVERGRYGAWLVWMAALSIVLLRAKGSGPDD